jgi:hypothetical protein
MYRGEIIRLVATLVLMFAYLIMRSKLAEYRTDDLSADGGMGRGIDAARQAMRTANYSEAGRRLLPWLRLTFAAMVAALLLFVFGPHAT